MSEDATRRLLMRFVCSEIHEKLVFLFAFKRFKDTQAKKEKKKETEKKPQPLVEVEDKQSGQRVPFTSVRVCACVG